MGFNFNFFFLLFLGAGEPGSLFRRRGNETMKRHSTIPFFLGGKALYAYELTLSSCQINCLKNR